LVYVKIGPQSASSHSGTAAKTAPSAAASPGAHASAATSSNKPVAIVKDPELERLLSEAWGLIGRGDHEPGRQRLQEARRQYRDDPRADFSLGLLDALQDRDWASAEKRFADCVRRNPENVPSLNNLALAQVHNKHESEGVKRWKAIVEQEGATPEIVQNLGYVRELLKQGKIRKNTALLKMTESLYTEAAVATSTSFQPQSGFRMMALALEDGRTVGWGDGRRMSGQFTPHGGSANPGGMRPGPSRPQVSPGSQSAAGAVNDPRFDSAARRPTGAAPQPPSVPGSPRNSPPGRGS
jgi:hypothetical protein